MVCLLLCAKVSMCVADICSRKPNVYCCVAGRSLPMLTTECSVDISVLYRQDVIVVRGLYVGVYLYYISIVSYSSFKSYNIVHQAKDSNDMFRQD